MTMERVQPKRNPAAGDRPSRRKTYCPPARGIMAASSAYARAPVTVIAPVITHTSSSAPGPQAETCRPMSADTMKIPEPIMEPTTSDMAASGPIPRINSDGADVAGGALAGAAIGNAISGWEGADLWRGGRLRLRRQLRPPGLLGRFHRLLNHRLPRCGQTLHH